MHKAVTTPGKPVHPQTPCYVQSDSLGNMGGPILGRLQVAEHRQLMRSYQVHARSPQHMLWVPVLRTR